MHVSVPSAPPPCDIVVIEAIAGAGSDRGQVRVDVIPQEGNHRVDRGRGEHVVCVELAPLDQTSQVALDRAHGQPARRRDFFRRLASAMQVERFLQGRSLFLVASLVPGGSRTRGGTVFPPIPPVARRTRVETPIEELGVVQRLNLLPTDALEERYMGEVAFELLLAPARVGVHAQRGGEPCRDPLGEVFDRFLAPFLQDWEAAWGASGFLDQTLELTPEFLRRLFKLHRLPVNALVQRDRLILVRNLRGAGYQIPPFVEVSQEPREGEQALQEMGGVLRLLPFEVTPQLVGRLVRGAESIYSPILAQGTGRDERVQNNTLERAATAERDVHLSRRERAAGVDYHPVQGQPLALVNRDCPSEAQWVLAERTEDSSYDLARALVDPVADVLPRFAMQRVVRAGVPESYRDVLITDSLYSSELPVVVRAPLAVVADEHDLGTDFDFEHPIAGEERVRKVASNLRRK